jgi:signal transduction histidine kinase
VTTKEIKEKFEISGIKRIVKAMGGKLDARSFEEVTTFSITVPCLFIN